MSQIVVAEDLSPAGLEILRKAGHEDVDFAGASRERLLAGLGEADALLVAGMPSGLRGRVTVRLRCVPRGKNGSAQPQGTRKRRYTRWHDDEIPAIRVLHSDPVRVPV